MKHQDYQRSGEIIEITIRDGTHAKLETRKASMSDKTSAKELSIWLYQKYGFFLPLPSDSRDGFFDW